MIDETNNPNSPAPKQPEKNAPSSGNAPSSLSDEKVILTPGSTAQQLQNQQPQPQVTEPAASFSQIPQINPNSTNAYSETSSSQIQVGVSASQLGLHEPKSKLFDFDLKQLIIKATVALVILGGVFTILVMSNFIALSEFKNVSYTNSQGVEYRVDFYSKHGKKELSSGNKQLVSKVSKAGKFPLNFSVSTDVPSTAYNRVKDCSSYTKITDVENSNLGQTIAVCDFGKEANAQLSGAVYVGGFVVDDKTHIITISQDYGDIDLSNQAAAQESLSKFGLDP